LSLTKTPTYFNTELLPPLSVHQIVFFDECRKKTEINRTGDTVYTFPKNEAGLYDKDGRIGDVDTNLLCKYTKEGRFCFGVSDVELSDDTIEGRRCETFDYSAKNLITITAEEKMIAEKIKRVRGLKSDGQWIEKRILLPGQLYEHDSVMEMGNIAEKTANKLKRHGIVTVLDMKMLTQTESSAILEDEYFRVSDGQIKEWHEAAQQAHEGSVPSCVRRDHRKDEKPYLSRYGRDEWMSTIHKCSALSGYCCVKEMMEYMVEETQRVMKGTNHEGHGKFYHDALTLMTCKKTIKYMKNKDYLKHWLLPLEGLQYGTRYNESIPVDSPELMPLYETLNMDIHESARYPVAITAHLPNDDPIKYSFTTPNEISREYLRLVHPATGGAPSCTQIVQDCEKWIRSLMKIRHSGGKTVEGFG
jgi:hypothetical protein